MKMTIREAFDTAHILLRASPATHARLMGCSRLEVLPGKMHIFFEKQPQSAIYILIRGAAALYKSNASGEKKVLLLVRSGELISGGALTCESAQCSCEALMDSVLLSIPVKQFIMAMEDDFSFTRAVLSSVNTTNARLMHHLKNTPNAITGEKKLAAKLYKLAIDFGKERQNGRLIDLDISITYLADMLGQKRETVSRQFKTLSQKGLAYYESHRFTVPDMVALSAFFHEP